MLRIDHPRANQGSLSIGCRSGTQSDPCANDVGGGNILPLVLICAFATPHRKSKTELRFGRMLDSWITFRHTLPASARK